MQGDSIRGCTREIIVMCRNGNPALLGVVIDRGILGHPRSVIASDLAIIYVSKTPL